MNHRLRQLGVSLKGSFLRYRGPFLVSAFASILTAVVISLFPISLQVGEKTALSFLSLQLVTLTVLILILFYVRHLFNRQADAASSVFYDFFGYSWQRNQYFRRKQHFVLEKATLCHTLVESVLPKLLASIKEMEEEPVDGIEIIIDSGTTLSPAFRFLPSAALGRQFEVPIRIHTNNIAGAEELSRVESRNWTFHETDFVLIDGNPLGRYRATTYETRPHPYLEKLWRASKQAGRVTVGVVTGNWILGGNQLTRLTICAKGRGHLEFKEEVVENVDYLVVVAPLGKILRLGDAASLNALLPKDEGSYKPIVIPPEKKEQTYLLTTLRGKSRTSPLADHSSNLRYKMRRELERGKVTENFKFSEDILDFNPPGRRDEVERIEVPHRYLRGRNFQIAYGYAMWSGGK